jgi:outer membrane protein assembly factor BamA
MIRNCAFEKIEKMKDDTKNAINIIVKIDYGEVYRWNKIKADIGHI